MARPPRTPLGRLAPARRRFWLAIGGVLAALVVAIAAPQVVQALTTPRVAVVAQDEPGTLLLVPGYGGSSDALEDLASALSAAGRAYQIVDPPGDGTGDLRAQAENLARVAREAVRRSGEPSVDVVGYSAGGVVARLWVADYGGAALARRVVTISAPSHGTQVAALATGLAGTSCPVACQQLVPDSDLLRELNAGDETPTGPLWAALWTTADQTVIPATSGSLSGAVDFSVQSICPGVGQVSHGDMPRTPAVINMVLSELGTRDPTVPSDRVCDNRAPGGSFTSTSPTH